MDVYGLASGVITKGVSLVQDPYAVSAQVTQKHQLGVTPSFIKMYLENKTAESGYNPGDRVPLTTSKPSADASVTMTISANASILQLFTTGATPGVVPNPSGVGSSAITVSSWKLVAVPYKVT